MLSTSSWILLALARPKLARAQRYTGHLQAARKMRGLAQREMLLVTWQLPEQLPRQQSCRLIHGGVERGHAGGRQGTDI